MDYTYIDNYNTTASGYMLSSAIITISLVIFLVGFFLVVLNYIGMWKVFVKAGIPGWKCLIPFYNTYLIFLHSIFMLILAFGHYQYYGAEQPGQA